jgi:hypothetical protein
MRRIEAIADSIAFANEAHVPESVAYRLRNPGLLRARNLGQQAYADDECRLTYPHLMAGYAALLDHLKKNVARHPLVSLEELLAFYSFKLDKLFLAVDFIQRALDDKTITAQTQAFHFSE